MQTVLAPALQVPVNLLTCPPQPVPGVVVSDADLTDFGQDAIDAGNVCRVNLGQVRDLLATQNGVK